MNRLKPISIYAFTIFFNAAISFATFSFLTHHLSEVDYGIINLYNSFLAFLAPFIAVGVQYVLGVDYFKMKEEAFKNHFTNAISIPLISTLIFTLLVFLFSEIIQQRIKVNFVFTILIPFVCLLTILSDVFLTLIRNKGKHYLFAGYSVFKNLVEIGLTLLLIIGLSYKWEGRLASLVVSLSITALVIAFFIKKWNLFTNRFDKKDIKKSFSSGLPFVPERLAIFVLGFSDRFFIEYYQTTGDVGYYSAAAQLAVIVNLTILTLSNAFYPPIFKALSLGSQESLREVRRITWLFIGLSAVVTIAVILSVPLFYRYFIGDHFAPGKIYAVYLIIGLFFWAVYNVFLAYLLNSKKNRLIMSISIIGMILSLTLNFFNVKYFGALGAAYTSMVVYFFMAFIAVYFVHRSYNLKKLFSF